MLGEPTALALQGAEQVERAEILVAEIFGDDPLNEVQALGLWCAACPL